MASLINYLNRVHLGPDTLSMLVAELKACGIRRPLLVTDPGLAGSSVVAAVLERCPPETVQFTGTPQNPTERAVVEAAARYREAGCDGLVAVGGGSPIDLAKGVAVLATHEGALKRYTFVEGGDARIRADAAPIIAIPTTAGTGSEVGRSAMITLEDGHKRSVRSPHLLPRVAICDARLTLGLPSRLTAATGMDALTHCIETFLSPVDNPVAEAIALRGATLAFGSVEFVTHDGANDLQARHRMMTAALMGGLAFQKGLGAVHALAHTLGAMKSPLLHHGTLNAVLLPAVLRFNRSHTADREAVLARALGLAQGEPLDVAITALNARLGLPAGLQALGVPESCLDAIAAQAPEDPSTRTNPRPVDAEGYRGILADAW